MTIEELNSVKRIREEIEREETRLESLRGLVPTSRFDDQPRTKPLMSVPERVTIAISELEMKLAGLRDRLADEALSLTEKIFDTFADDNQLMSSVLIRMYAAGLSADEVARSLGYTRGYIWKVHNQAIKRLKAQK